MTKPLGYYTSYNHGDGSVFEELQERYGSCLERMSLPDKYSMIRYLIQRLDDSEALPEGELLNLTRYMSVKCSESDLVGVLQALTTYIREVPSSD